MGLFTSKLLAGGAACLLIWFGIREMRRSSDQGTRDSREAREVSLYCYNETPEQGRRQDEETIVAPKALNERILSSAVSVTQ